MTTNKLKSHLAIDLSNITAKKIIIYILTASLFSFTIFLSFYNLGKAPFDNWDEAWYADVTRNILQNKDIIVLRWNNEIWLDKPPLYMWLSAITALFFGLSEFSMRLISAVSGALLILMVTIYSYKNFGIVPSLLAFSSIALNNIFIWRMRSGNIDVFLALLVFLTFLVLVSKNKYKYLILGFIFAAIFLTKASIVFYPMSIFIIHEIVFNRRDWKKLYKEYIKLFSITVLIPSIWLILGLIKSGTSFPAYYLLNSDQSVAKVALENFNTNYIMHTYYSLQRRFFFVFVIGLFFALTKIKDSRFFLLTLYSVTLITLLSFSHKDNNWYLIPSIPFWAILVAFGTYSVIRLFKNNVLVVALIVILSTYVSYRTFTINILPILDSSSVVKLSESAKLLNKITNKNDVIIRLDHLYPTTIYYSNRKVKVFLNDPAVSTDKLWISNDDLEKDMRNGNVHWVVGNTNDVASFKNNFTKDNTETIVVNDEETILHIN